MAKLHATVDAEAKGFVNPPEDKCRKCGLDDGYEGWYGPHYSERHDHLVFRCARCGYGKTKPVLEREP